MLWRFIAFSFLLCFLFAPSGRITGQTFYFPVHWEDWLHAIAVVESSNFILAYSWKGPAYGRGRWMVSEIALAEYKRCNPDAYWITPTMLYNTNIAMPIVLWLLRKHEDDFRRLKPNENIVPWVLSAYNCGGQATLDKGINSEYVVQVIRSLK